MPQHDIMLTKKKDGNKSHHLIRQFYLLCGGYLQSLKNPNIYRRLCNQHQRHAHSEFFMPCLMPEKLHRGICSPRAADRRESKQRPLAYAEFSASGAAFIYAVGAKCHRIYQNNQISQRHFPASVYAPSAFFHAPHNRSKLHAAFAGEVDGSV